MTFKGFFLHLITCLIFLYFIACSITIFILGFAGDLGGAFFVTVVSIVLLRLIIWLDNKNDGEWVRIFPILGRLHDKVAYNPFDGKKPYSEKKSENPNESLGYSADFNLPKERKTESMTQTTQAQIDAHNDAVITNTLDDLLDPQGFVRIPSGKVLNHSSQTDVGFQEEETVKFIEDDVDKVLSEFTNNSESNSTKQMKILGDKFINQVKKEIKKLEQHIENNKNLSKINSDYNVIKIETLIDDSIIIEDVDE